MPTKAEKVDINGKGIYYEVYGSGEPLILLHGYSLSSRSWIPYIADYEKDYTLYLIDLTGHGRSDEFSEQLSIESVAKDLNTLLGYLKLDKVNAIGFSFGGDVLFQLALLNPTLIKSMITIGALGSWDVKDFPEYEKIFTYSNLENFTWLRAYHTSESQIRAILEQFTHYTVNLSDAQLQSIQPEVLLILGDDDNGMTLQEVVRVREHLPESDLWIQPNVSHNAHEGESKKDFIRISKEFFLKGQSKETINR